MIDPHHLKRRLAAFEELRRNLEEKCNASEDKLLRHEVWRHAYASFPYLIGAPAHRISQMFVDIFMNLSEFGENGKIGGRSDFRSNDSFVQKYTHMVEEFNSRSGVPGDVVGCATKQLRRYIDGSYPNANQMFNGCAVPETKFLVKYGQREFLEQTLRDGVIRISPASFYDDSSLPDSIRDSETTRMFYIPTFRERISGVTSIVFDGAAFSVENDDFILRSEVANFYLYSMADSIYYRLPTDFNANAALIIREPALFARRFISSFLANNSEWRPMYGPVSYYDPYRDYKSSSIPSQMSKHFRYAYQREVRIAFVSNKPITTDLQPQFIRIGPMNDYAELRWV